MGIDNICQPFLDRRKKQRTRRSILAVSLLAAVCLIVGISVAVGGGTGQADPSASPSESAQVSETPEATGSAAVDESGTDSGGAAEAETVSYYADIEIQDYGTITVALDGEAAPETVANFVSLAEEGFYDGLTFHRIIEGFMMQGGDPNGDGTGGSGATIVGEFSDNGYENNLSHTRGAVSMARSSDYDSASSQFFIVQEDSTYLDGQYAVFGYVTEGMDVVDAICESAQPTDDNGTIPAEEQPVITSITIRTPEETGGSQ
ncbi:peptidylprolyl isomerase [Pseudoflavonifractor capillosus]|uniref:Peptidyl-prolyl cis-trans isomerase n=1 Tax=Pseudoflavonifractor capillosus TaxID=106588 RepID=A0A921SRN2_9FIRM|nr:peptidylprolyl isomerase [Pseudoflavonifractor capillosus]HJG86045.1 peptidylprolyl isomerase [Pseudoflavonifractor capillosus]